MYMKATSSEIIYCPTTIRHKGIRLESHSKGRGLLNIKLLFATVTVNLLAFATGNAYAWSSTVLIALKSNDTQKNPLGYPITAFEESWIASILSLGASVGPFLAGYCSDKVGRKTTLLMFSVPMMASHIILAFASITMEFYLARFMMGLGAGCVFTVIPIYVGEIAETNIRGLLGCFMGVLLSLGLLMVYSIGPYTSIMTLSLILMIPIGLFLILFGLFVPESPYYHIANGDKVSAEMSLSKLRKNDMCSIQKELAVIAEVVEESKNNNSLSELLKSRSFIKGIRITTGLMFFQQFVGITIILAYMESIFAATGSTLSSSTSTIIVAVIQTTSVVVSSSLVDMWGRRMLLIISSSVCALPLLTLGGFFYMKNTGMVVSHLWWLPIVSLVVYIIGYNFALGALPWALVGELFSSNTKAFASTATAFTCLFLAFILTLLFPSLEQLVGFHGVFWLFSANALFCLLFVLRYVPETKGKSFQEIQTLLEK